MSLNSSNFYNETGSEDVLILSRDVHAQLQKSFEIIMIVLLIGVMLAMGCLTTLDRIKTTLKRPWGVLIGMACQFIVLPLIAFGMAHATQLPHLTAQGSVCMTTASTVMAFGMMPLNLWIYTGNWSSTAAHIPYRNIVVMLASVIGPVGVGMLIQWRLPRVSALVVKVGSILGIVAIFFYEIVLVLLFFGVFQSHWTPWLCAALFPCVGFGFAYLLSFLFRQTPSRCRTIAIETSTQNVPLCFTLIMMTFPVDISAKIIAIPVLFAMFYLAEMSAIIVVYVLSKKLCLKAKGVCTNEEAAQMPLKDDNA